MKMLILHTKESFFKVTTDKRTGRKLRERGISLPMVEGPSGEMRNGRSLIFLMCAEKGDDKLKPKQVVDVIQESSNLLREGNVVLAAFAHLSERPMWPRSAQALLGAIENEVRLTTNLNVSVVPFGHDKSAGIVLEGHHYNVSFKSINPVSEPVSPNPVQQTN